MRGILVAPTFFEPPCGRCRQSRTRHADDEPSSRSPPGWHFFPKDFPSHCQNHNGFPRTSPVTAKIAAAFQRLPRSLSKSQRLSKDFGSPGGKREKVPVSRWLCGQPPPCPMRGDRLKILGFEVLGVCEELLPAKKGLFERNGAIRPP